MIESRTKLIALFAALANCAGAAHATVYTSFTNLNNYSWRVTYMPDFDQRRSMCTGIPGLPSNGSMYCVPVATLNVAAYVANHGYPFVNPGVGQWGSSQPATYNVATQNMATLGLLMSTHPTDGTDGNGWIIGSKAWFNPFLFSLSLKWRTS